MPVLPQIRFPFTKKNVPQPTGPYQAEHGIVNESTSPAPRGHRREKSTSSISILSKASNDEETNTYKLSVVNDSGVFVPPSPTEKKGFWGRTDSTASSLHGRDVPDVNDGGFAIPRESLDGYRRSFDISARNPINDNRRPSFQSNRSSFDAFPITRQSFDSRIGANGRLPSTEVSESASEDEEFKDVELNESQHPHKKRGFLGRLVGGSGNSADQDGSSKGRNRSSTLTWRREHNKDAEELSSVPKDNATAA